MNTKLLSISVALVLCLSVCSCATGKKTPARGEPAPDQAAAVSGEPAPAPVTLLRISANVDGSGRFIFTNRAVRYEHKHWSLPQEVVFNGQPWTDLSRSPATWRELSKQLDLTRAWIVSRKGRDVIALEPTAAGFDLYLCDSPNGSDDYEVTIAVPRRD